MRVLKRMTPGLDVKAIAEEIQERIVEELDYELEAQNQRSLARIFAGHPFIVVPDVVSTLSRERVLVSEFVQRRRLRGAQAPSAGRARPHGRDRVPLLPRLPVSPPAVLRGSAPGELPAAGRRAHGVPGLRAVQAPGRRARGARARRRSGRSWRATRPALHDMLAKSGFLPEPERVDPDHLLAFIEDAIWWYTTADETVELKPGDRDPRDDRELRSPFEPLPRNAPPGHASRASVRPAHGDAHARRSIAAACPRQLASDRPRVDVRRRARDRSGPRRG